ncbi:MAG: histidine kinase [Clostridium sp.]|nr:histidine kinase [Clostridium sp.]
MKHLIYKFQCASLFTKIALISLTCSLSIFIFTTFITLNVSKNVLIETFSNSNYKILNEVSSSFANLNDHIANVLSIIEHSSDFEDYLSNVHNDNFDDDNTTPDDYTLLYNIDKSFDVFPDDIYSNITVYIIGTNGKTYIKGHNYFSFDEDETLNSDLTHKAVKNCGKLVYGFTSYKNIFDKSTSTAITAAKVLMDKDSKEIYGYAYIVISQNDFRKCYMPFIGVSNNIEILSQDGTIVSSSRFDEIGTTDQDMLDISKHMLDNSIDVYSHKYKSINAAILSIYLPYYDFNLIGIIDKDIIIHEMFNTSKIFVINIVILLVFMAITSQIIRKTTEPLSLLSQKMSKISSGHFNDYLEIEGGTEIRQLTSAYNYMLDGINKYMNDILEMEKEKRKAEIHALQMQINPHFLYNTLTSIKWLIWQKEIDKSTKTIDAFIALLQNTISNRKEMITIDEEIENLKNYVFINHIRYGDKIKVNYFVNPECSNYKIPKLILQPFIENAFFHAFTDREDGLISVFINLRDDDIVAEIIDDGVGIPEKNINHILESDELKEHFTSIGINNVNDRIKLIYGAEYGVTISSELNFGTSVKIVIPKNS